MPKVSVIIPFYNVEKYFEKCLHSLFGQTLQEMEYVFVDDGSTDSSADILRNIIQQYPHRESQVRLISQPNQGVAIARANGIKAATGEFFIHCDADDYVDDNMYGLLYEEAIKTDADIVICNYILENKDSAYIVQTPLYTDPKTYIENLYRNNYEIGSLFNKLVKSDLIKDNKIYPYKNFNYAEDLQCVIKILNCAEKTAFVDLPLYHYVKRENSLSSNLELNLQLRLDHIQSTINMIDYLTGCNNRRYATTINCLKFYIKMRYSRELNLNVKDWYYFYQECHRDVMKFRDNSLKSRLILRMALSGYLFFRLFNRRLKIIQA